MVFPYLKGLINTVNHFYLYSDLIFLGFICIVLYFHIRSITSGIRALFWAQKWRIFINFLQDFGGGEFVDQICMFW